MKRRTYLAVLGSATTAGLAGCGSVLSASGPCSDGSCDVGMSGESFIPREYTVSVGDTVTWKNTSARRHTVTAYETGIPEEAEYFASGGYETVEAARDGWVNEFGGKIEHGDTYEHTFEVAGTYNYFCVPHEPAQMVGKIIVEE